MRCVRVSKNSQGPRPQAVVQPGAHQRRGGGREGREQEVQGDIRNDLLFDLASACCVVAKI